MSFEIMYNTPTAKEALRNNSAKQDVPLVRFENVGDKVQGEITAGRYVQVPVFGEFDINGDPVTEAKVQFEVTDEDGTARAVTILHTGLLKWVQAMQPTLGDSIHIEFTEIIRYEGGRTYKFECSLNGMWS